MLFVCVSCVSKCTLTYKCIPKYYMFYNFLLTISNLLYTTQLCETNYIYPFQPTHNKKDTDAKSSNFEIALTSNHSMAHSAWLTRTPERPSRHCPSTTSGVEQSPEWRLDGGWVCDPKETPHCQPRPQRTTTKKNTAHWRGHWVSSPWKSLHRCCYLPPRNHMLIGTCLGRRV